LIGIILVGEDGQKIIPPKKAMEVVKSWMNERRRRTFNKKTLQKRLPITKWLPKYSSDDAIGDLVAGITVGLTVIPQALAYSGIAGLPAAVSFFTFKIVKKWTSILSFFLVWFVWIVLRLFCLYIFG